MKPYEGAGNRKESDIEKLRVPVPPRIEIVVQDFMGFISEYASNVSKGGIFIATESAKPVGSELDFEFQLADGFSLIQGRGQVSWVREEAQGEDNPAGMGVRFLSLDAASRQLVDKMVTNYVAEGGKPFDVEGDAGSAPAVVDTSGAGLAAAAAIPPTPAAPAAEPVSPPTAPTPRAASGVPPTPETSPPTSTLPPAASAHAPPSLPDPQPPAVAAAPAAVDPPLEPVPLHTAPSQQPAARAPSEDAPVMSNETMVLSAQDLQALSRTSAATSLEEASAGDPSDSGDGVSEVVEEIRGAIGSSDAAPPPMAPGMDAAADSLDASRLAPPLPGGVAATLDDTGLAKTMVAPQMPTEVEQQLGDAEGAIDLGSGGISLAPESADDDLDIQFDVTTPEEGEISTGEDPTLGAAASGTASAAESFADPEPELETPAEPEREPELDPDGPRIDFSQQSAALDDFQVEFSRALTPEAEGVDQQAPLETEVDPAFLADDPELPSAADPTPAPQTAAREDSGAELLSLGAMDLEPEAPGLESLSSRALTLDDGLDDVDLGATLVESRPLRAGASGEALTSSEELENALASTIGSAARGGVAPARRRRPSMPKLSGAGILVMVVGLASTAVAFLYSGTLLERWAVSGTDVEAWSTELADRAEVTAVEASFLHDFTEGRGAPTVTITDSRRAPQPLTEVENVHWTQVDGATIVTLWGNGDFVANGTAYLRVNGDNPREVIKLRGVDKPYWESELVLGTAQVRRLRLGFEPQEPFGELFLVIDLPSQRVRLTEIAIDGRQMTLRLGDR